MVTTLNTGKEKYRQIEILADSGAEMSQVEHKGEAEIKLNIRIAEERTKCVAVKKCVK